MMASPLKAVEVKDKVLLVKTANESGEDTWYFTEYIKINALIILGAIFILFLLIFGRFKGFNTVLSMIFTCLAVFAVFIPAVLSALNIYFWSIIISF